MNRRAFSLIELLIVVAIMAALTGGAVLRIDTSCEQARTAALRHNLKVMRQAIDDFHADRKRWPGRLDELVRLRYLREVPTDPTTGTCDDWVVSSSRPGATDVHDVHSATEGYRWY